MSLTATGAPADWKVELSWLRCVACEAGLAAGESGLVCQSCGRVYPIREDVLVVKDDPAADNKIAADFYNSALWPKFRFWEWFFFVCNGGERRARNVILRHLPQQEALKLLDV